MSHVNSRYSWNPITYPGISTIVVIGGSGDWFDVQDTTIMMDNYNCLDVSKKARSICKTFCTGRVQFNGRGLVHQLSWPLAEDPTPADTKNSPDSGIMKEGRHMARMLCSIKLPTNFNQGGSVRASEDGHSVTFSSTYSGRTNSTDDNYKKRKIISSCDDDVQLSDPSRALGARGLPIEPKGVERSITIDLSKLEQRISTKDGALGIAFAIIFVQLILSDLQANYSHQSFGDSINTRSVSKSIVNGSTKEVLEPKKCEVVDTATMKALRSEESAARDDSDLIDNRLSTLLRRFDSLRGSWHVSWKNIGPSEVYNSGCQAAIVVDSDREQRFKDLVMAHKIHSEFLSLQDFTWPRLFEVAASINRMRGSNFSRKMFIN